MKSMLFRSIGVSIFLLSLSLFAFADGDMGAGSKTNPAGGGNAPTFAAADTSITTTTNDIKASFSKDSDSIYLSWLLDLVTDILS